MAKVLWNDEGAPLSASELGPVVNPPGAHDVVVAPPLQAQSESGAGAMQDFGRGVGEGAFGLGPRALALFDKSAPNSDAALMNQAHLQGEAERRSPYLYGAGTVAGGIAATAPIAAVTGGLPALAGRLPGVAGTIARWGAFPAEGALYGAAQGVGTNYGPGATDTASAALGGAFPGGIIGAGSGVLGHVFGGPVARLAGGRLPAPPAFLDALNADQQGISDMLARGYPRSMLPDAGPAMLQQGLGVATSTGPNASALRSVMQRRDESIPGAVNNLLDANFGRPVITTDLQRQDRAARRLVGDAYDPAIGQANSRIDPEPISDAFYLAKAKAGTNGPTADVLDRYHRMLLVPGTSELNPDPRQLQAVRSELKAALKDPDVPDRVKHFIGPIHDQMTAELNTKVPGLDQLDRMYAEHSDRIAALNTGAVDPRTGNPTGPPSMGARAFGKQTQGINPELFAREFNAMSPEVQRRQVQANRSVLDANLNTNARDLSVLKSTLGVRPDWAISNAETMYGAPAVDRVLAGRAAEEAGQNAYRRMYQNSVTAGAQAAHEEQNAGLFSAALSAAKMNFAPIARYAAEHLSNVKGAGNREAIADLLATQTPQGIAQRIAPLQQSAAQYNNRREMARLLLQQGVLGGVTGGFVPKQIQSADLP